MEFRTLPITLACADMEPCKEGCVVEISGGTPASAGCNEAGRTSQEVGGANHAE